MYNSTLVASRFSYVFSFSIFPPSRVDTVYHARHQSLPGPDAIRHVQHFHRDSARG